MGDDSERITSRVIFAFWAVVLIGLPFWWKTTEVYRAHLPFTDIDNWQDSQACHFTLPSQLHIYIPTTFTLDINTLEKELSAKLDVKLHGFKYHNNFPTTISINTWNPDRDGVNTHKNDPIGSYFIYVYDDLIDINDMTVGSDRRAELRLKDHSLDALSDTLSILIPPIYFKEYTNLGDIACGVNKENKNDVFSMRTIKYSSQYETIFSLMNNNPENLKLDWDIHDSIYTYLAPFLKEIDAVYNFTIDSQIQNYAPLSLQPKYKDRGNKPGYHYFESQDLPHFINSAEWNLASTITSYPSINFILYVPTKEEGPLYIHDSRGQLLSTNAFLIPRWGGIVIKNTPRSAMDEYRFTKKDLKPIINTFLSQLRSLVGIRDMDSNFKRLPPGYNVIFQSATLTGITTLEKDNLIRWRTLENVVNTISTLKSLAQLVQEIPNMVVQDHINDKVRQSLYALDCINDSLKNGHYVEALQKSRDAIELSEKAFFDPTMVSMLYFPDEHKYAIYMPLFVPISVPLIVALVKEFKKSRKTVTKEKVN
ncbi:phosphatidylinositol-glycan biosynthesis class S protein [Pilobolus umbonatus]|nr:phosphatidylinositol-glycan biosynthesis class S protein [Pilobolus umbonatus]